MTSPYDTFEIEWSNKWFAHANKIFDLDFEFKNTYRDYMLKNESLRWETIEFYDIEDKNIENFFYYLTGETKKTDSTSYKCYMYSQNPSMSWKIMMENPDKKWYPKSILYLSKYIPKWIYEDTEFITENAQALSMNPFINHTHKNLIENKEYMKHVCWKTIANNQVCKLSDIPLIAADKDILEWSLLCKNISEEFLETLLNEKLESWKNMINENKISGISFANMQCIKNVLSNPNINLEMGYSIIKNNPDIFDIEHLNFLSKHPAINIEFIDKLSEKEKEYLDWPCLTFEHPNIPLKRILSRIKNREWAPNSQIYLRLDRFALHPGLTEEILLEERAYFDDILDWERVSQNPNIRPEFLIEHFKEKMYTYCFINNENLTWEFVETYPEYFEGNGLMAVISNNMSISKEKFIREKMQKWFSQSELKREFIEKTYNPRQYFGKKDENGREYSIEESVEMFNKKMLELELFED